LIKQKEEEEKAKEKEKALQKVELLKVAA